MAHLRSFSLLLVVCSVCLPACGDDDPSSGGSGGRGGTGAGGDSVISSGGSGGSGGAPATGRPADPAQNDPAFTVVAPRYLMAGDGLTAPTTSAPIQIQGPVGVTAVDLWIDDQSEPIPLTVDGPAFTYALDATALTLGDHTLMFAERGAAVGFYKSDLAKGHALYVIVSTDWDFSDVSDVVLNHHVELHTAHPSLVITHLIGPYTFTDPEVTQGRRDQIVAWAQGMKTNFQDEIGLHIHPRCNFIEAAGLTCKTTPSVSQPMGDTSGYTVRLGAYSEAEWDILFAKANEIFGAVGLGKPTSFRAGAWTLELPVARALATAGFVVDSSPVNWPYLEEWMGYDLYTWTQAQWGPINDTSQPYFPTDDSIVPGGAGVEIPLLLVPDNGIMVDYWTVDEMTNIFNANWNRKALLAPVQVSTGFHPAPALYYSPAEYMRVDAFLSFADQFTAEGLLGPVVYITMSDATRVWQ